MDKHTQRWVSISYLNRWNALRYGLRYLLRPSQSYLRRNIKTFRGQIESYFIFLVHAKSKQFTLHFRSSLNKTEPQWLLSQLVCSSSVNVLRILSCSAVNWTNIGTHVIKTISYCQSSSSNSELIEIYTLKSIIAFKIKLLCADYKKCRYYLCQNQKITLWLGVSQSEIFWSTFQLIYSSWSMWLE